MATLILHSNNNSGMWLSEIDGVISLLNVEVSVLFVGAATQHIVTFMLNEQNDIILFENKIKRSCCYPFQEKYFVPGILYKNRSRKRIFRSLLDLDKLIIRGNNEYPEVLTNFSHAEMRNCSNQGGVIVNLYFNRLFPYDIYFKKSI